MAYPQRIPQYRPARRELGKELTRMGYTVSPGGEIDGTTVQDASLTLAKTDQIDLAVPGGDNGIMVCNDGNEYELLSSTAHSPGDVPTLQGDLTVAWAAPSGGSGLTSPQVLARGLGC